jgi:hypothetical protein
MPWLYHTRYRGSGKELEIGAFMPTARRKPKPRQSGADVIARFRELSGK